MKKCSLGIETSCDETSVSIVREGPEVLSLYTASSLKLHQVYGGVVPEIAHRKHAEYIDLVTGRALKDAGCSLSDIDVISVTSGPGLVGSLLVGINFARALSFALDKPLVEVNHLYAHIYAALFSRVKPRFPFIGMVVSGGHTSLFIIRDFDHITPVARTRDDACGESFDKVAKILNLGFPGGPIIDKISKDIKGSEYEFRCGHFKGSLDFSFSGIKTAVLYKVKELEKKGRLTPGAKKQIAFSFQREVIDSLIKKILEASLLYGINRFAIGGGVSANSYFREQLEGLKKKRLKVFCAPLSLTQDNAAMVAGLGLYLFNKGKYRHVDF